MCEEAGVGEMGGGKKWEGVCWLTLVGSVKDIEIVFHVSVHEPYMMA